jgi:endoribonuclease Nob1
VKVLVLDTSALIMGLDPSGLELQSYSVPEVTDELRNQTGPSYRLSLSTSSGKLKIQNATPNALNEVRERSRMLGDHPVLSKTDGCVLALAMDLKREGYDPVVVSDDYAVQNVAEGMNLSYQSLASLGIRQKYNWIHYCPACYRRYSGEIQVCGICGTKLKRRPTGKQRAVMHAKG